MAQGTFYLQLAPLYGWSPRASDDDKPINGLKAVGLTQKKPARPFANTIVVKLTVEVPAEAFRPLAPEAVITIPASLIQSPALQVMAEELA